jgi:hypothetical protein
MLGATDTLATQEQHLVLEQGRLDLCEKPIIAQRIRQLHIDQLRAYGTGQRVYLHHCLLHFLNPGLLQVSAAR